MCVTSCHSFSPKITCFKVKWSASDFSLLISKISSPTGKLYCASILPATRFNPKPLTSWEDILPDKRMSSAAENMCSCHQSAAGRWPCNISGINTVTWSLYRGGSSLWHLSEIEKGKGNQGTDVSMSLSRGNLWAGPVSICKSVTRHGIPV